MRGALLERLTMSDEIISVLQAVSGTIAEMESHPVGAFLFLLILLALALGGKNRP
jgi:hypothetical protein